LDFEFLQFGSAALPGPKEIVDLGLQLSVLGFQLVVFLQKGAHVDVVRKGVRGPPQRQAVVTHRLYAKLLGMTEEVRRPVVNHVVLDVPWPALRTAEMSERPVVQILHSLDFVQAQPLNPREIQSGGGYCQ
jgi:hypothetical protein